MFTHSHDNKYCHSVLDGTAIVIFGILFVSLACDRKLMMNNSISLVCSFLLLAGANVAAVNNDGDLAIDLAEGEDVEELLMQWMEKEGKTE